MGSAKIEHKQISAKRKYASTIGGQTYVSKRFRGDLQRPGTEKEEMHLTVYSEEAAK